MPVPVGVFLTTGGMQGLLVNHMYDVMRTVSFMKVMMALTTIIIPNKPFLYHWTPNIHNQSS